MANKVVYMLSQKKAALHQYVAQTKVLSMLIFVYIHVEAMKMLPLLDQKPVRGRNPAADSLGSLDLRPFGPQPG